MALATHKEVNEATASSLLDWYDRHRRRMPWRALPGETADPYRVWLSEIMLQQTTVAVVRDYFERFTGLWPTVEALAAAPLDAVLTAWAGLGYYARARNLHACATAVVAAHGGRFPADETALLALPGVGPYTAAAIAAIAFDLPATPVDGNVERVMARLHAVQTPLPTAKPELKKLAAALTPNERPGDYAQAVMDLGATVCTPRSPTCLACPWQAACQGRRAGDPAALPRKLPKKARPMRHGQVFWLQKDGAVLLRRRPGKGLLGGMMEFPGSAWGDPPDDLAAAPAEANWRPVGEVAHGFTHFELRLAVYAAETTAGPEDPDEVGFWQPIDRLADVALPTAMTKVAKLVLEDTK